MAHIAQAYIHLKPYEITARELRTLGAATDEIARTAAREVFQQSVEIDVEIEEGTLWARIGVIGGLIVGGLHLVSEYKDIKEGAHLMCEDARKFGFDVCGQFTKKAKAQPSQIYRTEKRLKTPGRIYRLVARLERLNANIEHMSKRDVRKELEAGARSLRRILEDLNEEEAKAFTKGLKFENLPRPADWPQDNDDIDMPRVATLPRRMAPEREETELTQAQGTVLQVRVTADMRSGVYRNSFVVPAARLIPKSP
jgi:hypothetical protein